MNHTTDSRAVVAVDGLRHRYRTREVLHDLRFEVPEGAIYALLGANGTGKSTLLRLIAGITPVQTGQVTLWNTDVGRLSLAERQRIAYVAEGQQLPRGLRLSQLEAYCAPLYPTWDVQLASSLRARFGLDAKQRVSEMSRGERMKVSLLLALAARPRLLIMDEPFTGMDVAVKDELVRGLLDSIGEHGWSVLVATHDIAEIEMMADWVGFLRDGRLAVSSSLEALQEQYGHLEIQREAGIRVRTDASWPDDWRLVQEAGGRISALIPRVSDSELATVVRRVAGENASYSLSGPTLRELYLGLGHAQPGALP